MQIRLLLFYGAGGGLFVLFCLWFIFNLSSLTLEATCIFPASKDKITGKTIVAPSIMPGLKHKNKEAAHC